MIKLDYYRRRYRPWHIFFIVQLYNLKFLHKKY